MSSFPPSPTSTQYSPQPIDEPLVKDSYQEPSQYTIPPSYSAAPRKNGVLPPTSTQTYQRTKQAEKVRLRKACDSCSVRKVKCDESGPPCRSCAVLAIPCTFQRPSRRRGPPNKHAEAFKRQKTQHDPSTSIDSNSPTQDAAFGLVSLSSHAPLSAESICSISTLHILVDDYFTYIHPLIPLPHEPTFRAMFARREDRTDRTFLALMASMIEILVVSFPRRPRQLFTSESARKEFPNAEALISRCHQVFVDARGSGYLDRELTIYDAIASYLTGTSAAYMFDLRRNRLYFGEGVLIMRTLNLHRPRILPDPTLATSAYAGIDGAPEIDYVTQEMARRLFWIFYVGCGSIRQLGSSDSEILMPPLSYAEQLPPMALEIDDAYISPTRVERQPAGIVSELVGFNLNVLIFRSYSMLTSLEMAFGSNELYDWEKQKRMIGQTLRKVKSATDSAPPELQLLNPPPDGVWPWPARLSISGAGPRNSWADAVGLNDQTNGPNTPQSKRAVQYEIQKANIYASQLGTRSYLVEKYWNLYELQDRHSSPLGKPSSPTLGCFSAGINTRIQGRPSSDGMDTSEQTMAIEREDIVRDLAVLLQSISQVNMEPNGLSFCHKIRQVASTLLETPRSRMAMPSLDSESVNIYLTGFLDILVRLERLGPSRIRGSMNSGNNSSVGASDGGLISTEETEEEELVHWASLKEHQEKFARANGFLSTL